MKGEEGVEAVREQARAGRQRFAMLSEVEGLLERRDDEAHSVLQRGGRDVRREARRVERGRRDQHVRARVARVRARCVTDRVGGHHLVTGFAECPDQRQRIWKA